MVEHMPEPELRADVPDSGFESKALLFLFIVLIPLQDTALRNTPLKEMVPSPAVIPLSLLFLLKISKWLFYTFPMVRRSVLCPTIYVTVVSISYVLLFGLSPAQFWKPFVSYGLLSILYLFATFGIDYSADRVVRYAIYVAFAITVLGILTDLNFSSGVSLLRATANSSGRPRGFSSESSSLSVQVVTTGMLSAHFLENNWKKWAVIVVTSLLLIYSDSKGGLIAFLLCFVILMITKMRRSWVAKIAFSLLLIPVTYVGSLLVISRFTNALEENQTATVATRLSMTVYALITVAHNPLGVGFAGFLPSIPKYLPDAMAFVERILPFPMFFTEVREYLYPPQANADCKTFFFDFLVFFGIPFALVFVRVVYRILHDLLDRNYSWMFMGVMFSVFALVTYYSSINLYSIPLMFGIALNEIGRAESPLRLQ